MMMLPIEVIESVLYESGINRAKTKEIIERSKLVMSERLIDIQPYMNSLYMKAIELGVKPAQMVRFQSSRQFSCWVNQKHFLGWPDCKKD